MISNLRYWFLIGLIVLVYIAGMFATLMENDSAQFAVMAMRMVQENDFLNLFKGPNEYLDKPHMHYWLAALSYKVFGITDWAYRIPGFLATLLGAYSCYGLGNLLYNKDTGKLAALIFLTAQTIVLGVIDVRTDAVLTGFVIFSIWQLMRYVQNGSLAGIILGAFGAAIAFSTKGQIALVVLGLPLLCQIAYSRKWKVFIHWKVLVALAVFAIGIVPMLYAYYHQFDLHPEKVIRGTANRSGIFFIFWQQSFERLSGEGIGKNSSDYFFFFHTFLWVFLPWTIMAIAALSSTIKRLIKTKMALLPSGELLTTGGIVLIFILISFAQFKLPHYLNVTIPLFAVLTASYLVSLHQNKRPKTSKSLLIVQYTVMAIVFMAAGLLCFYVFKISSAFVGLAIAMVVVISIYFVMKNESRFARLVTVSVCASLLLNIVLNLHFYPKLLAYQGGSEMAKVVAEHQIPTQDIYKLGAYHTWALDFYNKRPVAITNLETAVAKRDFWMYCNTDELEMLKANGLVWDKEYQVNQFRITRLQAGFLNPVTRSNVINRMFLVHIP